MVSQVGGHLASSLGMVEVIVALLRVLDVPTDRIVYDVSHQAYPHKVCSAQPAHKGTEYDVVQTQKLDFHVHTCYRSSCTKQEMVAPLMSPLPKTSKKSGRLSVAH